MEGLNLDNILDEQDFNLFDDNEENNTPQNAEEDNEEKQTAEVDPNDLFDGEPESVTKWFNDQQYTFPTVAWLQMLNALEVYAAEALNVTEAHRSAVMAMDNIEDVEEYDITIGYPQKLNLSAEWLRSQS